MIRCLCQPVHRNSWSGISGFMIVGECPFHTSSGYLSTWGPNGTLVAICQALFEPLLGWMR